MDSKARDAEKLDCNGNAASKTQSIESIATTECPSVNDDYMTRSLNCCRRIPCCGIILAALTSVFFGFSNLVVKLVPKVNPFVVASFIMFINFIVFLPFSLYFKYNLLGVPGERMALFIRGFCGFSAVATSFIAYRMISLSDATTIIAAAPVFVSIFACIILKEECGVFQVVTVAITIVGVALVAKPSFIFGDAPGVDTSVATRAEGSILALISSLTGAGVYIAIRRLPTTPSLVVINSYCSANIIGSVIISCILVNFFPMSKFSEGIGIPTTWTEVGWLTLSGISGTLGQVTITTALKIEEAGLVSIARTADIIVAFLFQFIFLASETTHWTSYLGAVIVALAVSSTALRRYIRNKPDRYLWLWTALNCGCPQPRKPIV